MNETKKLLIGFVIVGGLCVCIAAASFFIFRQIGNNAESMVKGDPTSVAKISDKIAEFDTPPGYKPMAMNMFIYDMVTLTPDTADSGSMIMLMQYNGLISGNSAQVEQQLRQAAQQQSSQPGVSMHFVDTLDKEIRGQTVVVTVSEGDYRGYEMRQWVAVFEGRKGPTILIIQGPVETWDDALVDDFIKSIK